IEHTFDLPAVTNSAKVVFKNAEEADQITEAARILKIDPPDTNAIPLLSTNDTGLEVVLIPLAPCNPWLLDDAARLYERITDVPVKIRRLDKEWAWGTPDRIARQRDIESILVRLTKRNINFSSWNRDQYISALTDTTKSEDAFSKYSGQDLVEKFMAEPGQY